MRRQLDIRRHDRDRSDDDDSGSSSSNDDNDGNDGDTIRNSIQRATPTPSTNDNDSRNTADLATPIEETPRNTPRSFRMTDNEF